ncbi:hypothetical protein Tco_1143736 [Tanacetum coccineum]
MANLEFCDKHNMIAYLQKPERSEGFHQIIDFLNASHIQYALIENPTIYVSFIKQFWSTTTARTSAIGEVELTATIDGQEKTITEASLRRHLKLEDNGGVTTLPNLEIFEHLALMGRLLQPHTRTYSTPVLTQKVFSNMKRVTQGYSGEDTPLFASMITTSETSPSRITSLPSLSPQHTPFTAPSTSQPSNIHTTLVNEEAASMPHESLLQSVHSLGRDEGSLSLHELTIMCTKLSNKVTSLEAELAQTKHTYGTALTKLTKKVKKLEQIVKTSQSSRRTRVVPSHDTKIQEKISDDTEVLLKEEKTAKLVEEPTELVEDQGSGEKGEQEVTTADTTLNTASVPISTASATPEVSTAAANLVYIRRSVGKRKDKGKAIMIEDESIQKKSKKQLEQERLSYEEAIRLQEQIHEEERKRISRDADIAKQLQEEYDKAGKKEAVAEVDTTHVIDWNDPTIIRYHALQNRPRSIAKARKNMLMYLKNQGGYKMKDFKGMSYDDIRPIFEKVWYQVYSFVPMDSEEELSYERYNSSGLTEDKEIELWVELKMLFEPDAENILELQKYMHDPLKWWLYDMCAVHHVSTEKGQDIFMLVEKDYPLTKGLATLMLCNKLRVDQQSEMADELLIKIYNIANRPRN